MVSGEIDDQGVYEIEEGTGGMMPEEYDEGAIMIENGEDYEENALQDNNFDYGEYGFEE